MDVEQGEQRRDLVRLAMLQGCRIWIFYWSLPQGRHSRATKWNPKSRAPCCEDWLTGLFAKA